MQRTTYALVALLGCGRIGFDASDRTGDGATGGPRISTQLPDGGQMMTVTEAPDGTWYATSVIGTAYRSDDRMSWVRCGARFVKGLAVDTAGQVWVGGPDIARSTDRCATWQNTGSPRYAAGVAVIGTSIYGLLDDRLVRYNGSGWTDVPTPLGATTFWSMARSGTVVLAGASDGIARTTDEMSWTAITTNVPTGTKDVAVGATRAYVIANNGGTGLVCSSDSGQTWAQCDAGGYSIIVDPADDQRVLAGIYDDFVVTTNGFASATRGLREAAGLDNASILDLVRANDGTIVVASERGIFAAPSIDTLAFEPRMSGLYAWDIDEMFRAGDDIYLGTFGGPLHATLGEPFTSSTTGINWNTRIAGFAALPDGRILAVGRNYDVSSDRGATWTELAPLGAGDGYFANCVEVAGGRVYVGTRARIMVADPPYAAFTPLVVGGATREILAIRVVDGTIYAGAADGVFVSTDGASFTMLSPASVRAITVLADGRLAIATTEGVIVTDTSRTMLAPATLTDENVTRVVEAPGALVAATERGAWYSRDRGLTWDAVPGATMQADDVLYDGELVLGTRDGLVRVPLP